LYADLLGGCYGKWFSPLKEEKDEALSQGEGEEEWAWGLFHLTLGERRMPSWTGVKRRTNPPRAYSWAA